LVMARLACVFAVSGLMASRPAISSSSCKDVVP
jgi:hypothetical protein